MKRSVVLAVVVATLLGLSLRINDLGRPGFSTDEGHSAWMAAQPLVQFPALLGPDAHPPLYFALLHLWQKAWPSDVGLRIFSVICGTAAIPLMFLIARRLLGIPAGIAASFLMACSSMHVRYSQIARNYALVFLLAECALLALVVACADRKARWPWILFAGALTGLLYTHAVTPFTIAGLGIFFLFHAGARVRELARPWLGAHLAAAVLFLPWFPVALSQVSEVARFWWMERPGLRAPLYTFANSLLVRPAIPARPFEEIPGIGETIKQVPYVADFLTSFPHRLWWGLPAMAALLCAALLLRSGRWRLLLGLAGLFGVPVLGVWLVSQGGVSIYHPKVLLPSVMTVPLLLAVPFGFSTASAGRGVAGERRIPRWLVRASSGLVVTVIAMMAFSSWHLAEVRKPTAWREAADFLVREAEPGDAFVFDAHFGQILTDRYQGEAAEKFPRYGLPSGWYEVPVPTYPRYVSSDADLDPLRRATERHCGVWLVLAHTWTRDPDRLALGWAEANLDLTLEQDFLGVSLRRYRGMGCPAAEDDRLYKKEI